MPRLPDTLGALPTPQPSAAVATPQYGEPGEAQVARSMEASAGQLEHAGNELFQAFKQEKARVDKARVEDAFNELRNAQLDLTVGQENGFMNIKGGAAVKQPLLKDFTGKLSTNAKLISDSLQNDEQRQAFKAHADVAQSQFAHDILTHVYRQNEVYQKEVFEGTVKSEENIASTHWDAPMVVNSSLVRVDAAVDARADQMGIGRDKEGMMIRDEMKKEEFSKIHATVLNQAIATKQYNYAADYFKNYQNELTDATRKSAQKALEDAGQKQVFDGFQSAFLASKDSGKGLSQLYTAVNSDKVMDESRKNILIGRIQSRMELLENRAERERDRAERALQKDIDGVVSLSMQGFDPTPEQLQSLANRAKGTPLQADVNNMVATANFMGKFRLMNPQQQAATVREWNAVARENPNKFNVTLAGKLKTVSDNMQKQVAEDPVSFTIAQGFVKPEDPAAQPLSLKQPDAAQLSARFTLARSVAANYGQPTIKPLTSDEVSALQNALANAKPEEKRAYFGMLASASQGDTEGYAAMMAQLAPKAPTVAFAGLAYARKYATTTGASVSDLVLRGHSLLNPKEGMDGDGKKLFKLPEGADRKTMTTLFNDQIGDVAIGRAEYRHQVEQTAMEIYAALSEKDKDGFSGVLDTDRWKASIDLATGGTYKYNSRTIVAPWGMPVGKFKDGVSERLKVMEATGGLPEGLTASKVSGMPLINIGDGKYVVMAGDSVLVGKDKKDVVIDFNKPAGVIPSVKAAPKQKKGGSMIGGAVGFE